jgi:hypothetical protein
MRWELRRFLHSRADGSVAPSAATLMECGRFPKIRNPSFRKRWFSDDVMILSVRWYLRFKLSYRDLAQVMSEFGIQIAPSTILRWVIRYAVNFAAYWRPFKGRWGDPGAVTRPISRWAASGCTCTARWTSAAIRYSRISVAGGIVNAAKAFFSQGAETPGPAAQHHSGWLQGHARRATWECGMSSTTAGSLP